MEPQKKKSKNGKLTIVNSPEGLYTLVIREDKLISILRHVTLNSPSYVTTFKPQDNIRIKDLMFSPDTPRTYEALFIFEGCLMKEKDGCLLLVRGPRDFSTARSEFFPNEELKVLKAIVPQETLSKKFFHVVKEDEEEDDDDDE